MPPGSDERRAPLDALRVLAVEEVELAPGLRHLELFTFGGMLSVLWHGDPAAERVLLAVGGAMGGLLGPAGGLYHDLGVALADHGVGTLRIDYRRANDLDACVHDVCAAADLAGRRGARRFVVAGHSFGGAVAVRAGVALSHHTAGVVTLATQSAGCEVADQLGRVPLLLLHGDRDELLPVESSAMVRTLAGQGELVVLPDTGHLLAEAADDLRARLLPWVLERLGEPSEAEA